MANIIDSLVVSLGLDNSAFKKGIKDSEKENDKFVKKVGEGDKKQTDADRKKEKERKRQHSEEQRQHKASIESLGKIRNQALAMLGLFTAGKGLLGFTKDIVTTTAALGRMSENTDMSVNELSGWNQTLERTGGTAQEMQSTIATMTKELAKNKAGMQSVVIEYAKFGGSMQHGELDKTRNYLLGIADLLQSLSTQGPAKQWMVAEQLGLSEGVFNLLKQGRNAVERQIADGARMTGINKSQSDEARKAQKAWADMAATLESVGRAVLFPILKAISAWTDKHGKDINLWIAKLKTAIEGFTPDTVDKIGDAISGIVDGLKLAYDLMVKISSLMDKTGMFDNEEPGAKSTGSSLLSSGPFPVQTKMLEAGGNYLKFLFSGGSQYAKGVTQNAGVTGSRVSNNSAQTTININTPVTDPRRHAEIINQNLTSPLSMATQANGF